MQDNYYYLQKHTHKITNIATSYGEFTVEPPALYAQCRITLFRDPRRRFFDCSKMLFRREFTVGNAKYGSRNFYLALNNVLRGF